jgi:hypothetical protein
MADEMPEVGDDFCSPFPNISVTLRNLLEEGDSVRVGEEE